MKEEIVRNICFETFNVIPNSIQRNHVGIAAYVYTIEINETKYVLKLSERAELISGSTYWLKKLQSFEIPIPKIITVNSKKSPYYFIMTYIHGQDLGLVYSELSSDQKRNISHELHDYQNKLKGLPAAKGYGFLHAYEDRKNMKKSWREVVISHINRSEQCIAGNGIFSIDYVNRVKSYIPFFDDYFNSIKAEPFFDDATTKNVLIDQGKLSGIIDLDWICFGDRLYVIALTTMSLLNMHADLEYVEYWKDLEKINDFQEKVLQFYILVFCIDFMAEKGMKFNKEKVVQVNEEEIVILKSVFEMYNRKLQLTTAST